MTINPEKTIQQRLALSIGLDKYEFLQNHVFTLDVSTDIEFQRIFNGFYRIRRNKAWRTEYYKLFESLKSEQNLGFSTILRKLHEKTGNVEPSFSSKMLATLSTNMPIWDRYVIQNLCVTLPSSADPERLEKTEAIYSDIVGWYECFLQTENAKECIHKFNEIMPDYSWVSDVKKIDFYLWSIR